MTTVNVPARSQNVYVTFLVMGYKKAKPNLANFLASKHLNRFFSLVFLLPLCVSVIVYEFNSVSKRMTRSNNMRAENVVCGYGRRPMIERPWVQIPPPDTS